MICSKWSLLTGPATIMVSVISAVVVVNYLFIENDRFPKSELRKQKVVSSSK